MVEKLSYVNVYYLLILSSLWSTGSAQSTTEISVADKYPLWDYDWSAIVTETQWLFLLNPRPWTWVTYACPDGCCSAICETRDPSSFEYCISKTDQTCRVEATARIDIRREDFLCLIRNPAFGDYEYDGSYYGYQLEWDVSWLPTGANPYWLQWDGLQNDCADQSVYLRNAYVAQGTCKPEMTWGDRQQIVNSTTIGIFYDGQMSSAYGATRAMFMVACRSIDLNWDTVKPYYEFKVSSLGLRNIVTPIVRPSTTPAPPTTTTQSIISSSESTHGPAVPLSDESNHHHTMKFASMLLSFLVIVHA